MDAQEIVARLALAEWGVWEERHVDGQRWVRPPWMRDGFWLELMRDARECVDLCGLVDCGPSVDGPPEDRD